MGQNNDIHTDSNNKDYLNLNIDLQVKFKFSLRLESQQVLMRYLYLNIIFENKEIRRLGNL